MRKTKQHKEIVGS